MIKITMATVIAWHEAGHAVIARALKIPLEFVSIEGDIPKTRYARERTPEEGVWTTLAAAVTLIELTGSKDLADYGAAGDLTSLEQFLRRFPTEQARELAMSQAEKGLPKLIRANKTGIKNVAEQLIRKGKLSGKEVDRLMSACSRFIRWLSFWRN